MCWMCLLVGSPKISVHDRCQWMASSQELLSSYTSDKEMFCRRLVTGDKMWIYHWDPLEFMQWKDVNHPTFTRICNSAINWLDCGNSFSGIETDCLWQTICILHSSYLISSSRNSDESSHLGVWLFHDNAPAQKSLVAQQALCNCEFV